MKIVPVILCGGAGTRLWPKSKKNIPKQFIDFGGWTLFQKTLSRIKNPIYDNPIISTNFAYLDLVKYFLSKYKVFKYKIVIEPYKKNTAAAILSCTLLNEISNEQSMVFFPADQLIEKSNFFNRSVKRNNKYLDEGNIFIFGIKPKSPSTQYGYFLSKKILNNINRVTKFIEKPKFSYAKKILKKNAYWNSGILFARKDSIINNFRKYELNTLKLCINSINNSKISNNICYLNKKSFNKIKEISFDYAILEKSKSVNAIKLNIPWTDLGSWKEISNIFKNNKKKYFKKSNVFYRPWGKYTNLFSGKGFLIKELVVNSKSSISLQKHNHRSEHWTISSGRPLISIDKKKFFKNVNETAFIPQGSIHRIENPFKSPVKIMEVQIGKILRESDIIRFKDIYGRVS